MKNKCENCGKIFENEEAKRFCSDFCTNDFIEKENIDAEENSFWEED